MLANSNNMFLKQTMFLLIAGLLSESLGIYLFYEKNCILIITLIIFIRQYMNLQTVKEASKTKNKKELKRIIVYNSIVLLSAAATYIAAFYTDSGISLSAFLFFLIIMDFASHKFYKVFRELRVMQLAVLLMVLCSLLAKYTPYVHQAISSLSILASRIASQVSGKPCLIGSSYSAASLEALFLCYFAVQMILSKTTRKLTVSLLIAASPVIINFIFLIFWSAIQDTVIMSALSHIPMFAPLCINFAYFAIMLIPLKFSVSKPAAEYNWTGYKKAKLIYAFLAVLLLVNAVLLIQNFFYKDEFHKNIAFYQVESMPLNFGLPSFENPGLANVGMFGLLPRYLDADGYKTFIINEINKEKLKNVDTLVIINLYQKFTEQEKADIWEFVKNGGALLASGDHTGTEQIREPFNHLLEPVRIAFNFDSAIPLVTAWPGGYEWIRHPIMDKVKDNEIKINIGASLSAAPPAEVVITGKYGYSDKGNMGNREKGYLGDMKYNPGEQLGDIPLVASASYGKGKVLVFGDTTTFQNTVIAQSYRFVENIFSWLSDKDTQNTELCIFLFSILSVLVICLAGFKAYGLKEVSAIALVALILISIFYCNTSSKVNIYGDIKADKAFITYSNGEYMDFDRTGGSVDGLVANLLRNNFIPFINIDTSNAKLSGDKNIMIINAPTIAFSSGKIKAIKTFVDNGGLVVLATGWREAAASKELLGEFGISVLNLPVGRITREENKDAKAEFWEAWALKLDSSYNTKPLVTVWNYPVAAYSKYGKGYFIAIGDSAFLLNKNLESVEEFSQTNIDFLKKIFEQYRKGGVTSE